MAHLDGFDRGDGVLRSAPPPDAATRRRAQLVLAGRALNQPDPEGWLADMLACLGLTTQEK